MAESDIHGRPRHWWRRLGWLVLIWGSSVGGVLLLAALLKLAMRAAGLSA